MWEKARGVFLMPVNGKPNNFTHLRSEKNSLFNIVYLQCRIYLQ